MVKDQGFLTQNFVGAEIDLRWNYVPGVEDDSSFVCGVHPKSGIYGGESGIRFIAPPLESVSY